MMSEEPKRASSRGVHHRNAAEGGATDVSQARVDAFRLSRHQLFGRAPAGSLASVILGMAGAQSQVLLAGQMSVGARVRGLTLAGLNKALWEERVLARVWCMRRTLYLVPSDSLALFVRGTARRPEYVVDWALSRGVPQDELESLIGSALEVLRQPRTKGALARELSKSTGYALKYRQGGGWGDKGKVASLQLGKVHISAGLLLHMVGARGAVCLGPNEGNESTYVAAKGWLRHWKDVPPEAAEKELLRTYLRAFGPATMQDFAWWMGLYVRDAKEILREVEGESADVVVDGKRGRVLRDDLDELVDAELEQPSVKLLPYFDSFMLGHQKKGHLVGPGSHKKVYRSQGWVSPVLLVDGRVRGTWSHKLGSGGVAVKVAPFAPLSREIRSRVGKEADELARFLGAPSAKVSF
jgi:DNA glycosylase AlkZ-like